MSDPTADLPEGVTDVRTADRSLSARLRRPLERLAALPVEGWITFAIVGGCVAFVATQLGFSLGEHELFGRTWGTPNLLLEDTTPAGGDMGAHVWGPAFLRDELLSGGRLTGWTKDWYAGFPAYQFYMLIPSLLIALLSYVIPYGVAFKLVAVSGLVSLPVSAWAFGRLARLPFPGPALFAVGATAFLFDRAFSIYGGNIASTLAGEFAFSMSLSIALVYLGVLARGLRTGQHRVLAAVLLALVGLTHLIPAIFAVAATAVMLAVHPGSRPPWRRAAHAVGAVGLGAAAVLAVGHLWPTLWGAVSGGSGGDHPLPSWLVVACWGVVGVSAVGWLALAPGRQRWWWMATTMPVAAALSAFWVAPFYLRSAYLNDMGWEKKTNYTTLLFDRGTTEAGRALDSGLVDSPPLQLVLAIALVGVLMSVLHRRRVGVFLAVTAVVAGVAFWAMPEGRLWNARLTPFYYLCAYLLAGLGVAEVGRLLAALFAPDVSRPLRPVRWATAALAAVVTIVALALPLHTLPYGKMDDDGVTYRWMGLSTTDNSFLDSWAEWNFSGYEGKPAWPEYRDVVATMAEVGEERGCGRAMWEHEPQHDRYGTPMALMLLPFWTEGCIGSMEGLYFEASATTPFHFLNQDQLSANPSNAQRDLPYAPGAPTADVFDLGIQHLQMLGVRYYLAISSQMQGFADGHPDLTPVATSGPWVVYEVADAPLVAPLENEPVVVEGADAGGETWQDLAICWYQDDEAWSIPIADDGPSSWARVRQTVEPEEDVGAISRCQPEGWGWFGDPPPATPLEPVEVSDVVEEQDRISFRVDRTGVPVVVRSSYFPNWQVSGADGPWRVAPNLMVVVPTDEEVVLSYGWTGLDLASYGISLLGLVGLVLLWRAGRVDPPAPDGFWDRGEIDPDDPPPSAVEVEEPGSTPGVGDLLVGDPPDAAGPFGPVASGVGAGATVALDVDDAPGAVAAAEPVPSDPPPAADLPGLGEPRGGEPSASRDEPS